MSSIINSIVSITIIFSNGNIINYEISEKLISKEIFITQDSVGESTSILEIQNKEKICKIDLYTNSVVTESIKTNLDRATSFDFYNFEIEKRNISGYDLLLLKKELIGDILLVHYYMQIDELDQFKNINPNLFLEDENKFHLYSGTGCDGLPYEEEIPVKVEIKKMKDFSKVVKDRIESLEL